MPVRSILRRSGVRSRLVWQHGPSNISAIPPSPIADATFGIETIHDVDGNGDLVL